MDSDPPRPGAALSALALPAGVAALWAAGEAFRALPGWAVVLPVLLVALPLWFAFDETAHLRRRSLLAAVTPEDGRLRRWLWPGRLRSGLAAAGAVAGALVLLSLLPRLAPAHWALLAADAVLLAVLAPWTARRLAGEVVAAHRGAVARGWPLVWANTAILALGTLLLDYFVVGAPDTRGMEWGAVAAGAFEDARAGAASAPAGVATGAAAAVEALAWHLAQEGIPSLPGGGVRILLWLGFLLALGGGAWLVTKALLGVAAALERRGPAGRGSGAAAFAAVAGAAAAGALGVSLATGPETGRAAGERVAALARSADPCAGARDAFADALEADIEGAAAHAGRVSGTVLDRRVDAAYARAAHGVDAYLDWHYSLSGSYARVLALLAGDLAGESARRFERMVVAGTGLDRALDAAWAQTEAGIGAIMARAGTQLTSRAGAAVRGSPCLGARIARAGPALPERLVEPALPPGLAGAAALSAARITLPLGRMAGVGVLARAATRSGAWTAGRAATRAGSRLAPVLGSGAAGAGLCAPLGPAALLCGVGGLVIAGVALDKAVVETDEALTRDDLRAELLEGLARARARTKAALAARLEAAVAAQAARLKHGAGRFVPARDG
jgi:hypothetical protein